MTAGGTVDDAAPLRQHLSDQLAERGRVAERAEHDAISPRRLAIPLTLAAISWAALLIAASFDGPHWLLTPAAALIAVAVVLAATRYIQASLAARALRRLNRARAQLAGAIVCEPWTNARQVYALPMVAGRYGGASITCRGGGHYRAYTVTRDPRELVARTIDVIREHVGSCGECSGDPRRSRERCETPIRP